MYGMTRSRTSSSFKLCASRRKESNANNFAVTDFNPRTSALTKEVKIKLRDTSSGNVLQY